MPIAIIGDLHFGIKLNEDRYIDYQIKAWKRFISHCKKAGIKRIISLGDFFDDRRYLSLKMLDIIKNQIINNDMKMIVIVGNHDALFKNTNKINSPKLIFGDHPNFKIVENKPLAISIDGKKCLLVPWMNKENKKQCIDAISKSDASFLFGHFEFNGFSMVNGIQCTNGLDISPFRKFDRVFSGHFHLVQTKKNIYYLGSFYQTTWNDYGDQKYFYILKEGILDKRDSSRKIYRKLTVDKDNPLDKVDLDIYKDCYLKVYLNVKIPKKQEKILSKLKTDAIKCDVIDNTILLQALAEDENVSASEDVIEILEGFMELQDDIDKKYKKGITNLLKSVYSESIEGI